MRRALVFLRRSSLYQWLGGWLKTEASSSIEGAVLTCRRLRLLSRSGRPMALAEEGQSVNHRFMLWFFMQRVVSKVGLHIEHSLAGLEYREETESGHRNDEGGQMTSMGYSRMQCKRDEVQKNSRWRARRKKDDGRGDVDVDVEDGWLTESMSLTRMACKAQLKRKREQKQSQKQKQKQGEATILRRAAKSQPQPGKRQVANQPQAVLARLDDVFGRVQMGGPEALGFFFDVVVG